MMRALHAGSRTGRMLAWLVAMLLAGCAALQEEPPPKYLWIVHDRDRSDADRVIDLRRKPEKLLEFCDVRPGMRVLDLSAGRGYNTELLARVVGPTGVVYAQHSRFSSGNRAVRSAFEERLKKPVMKRVVYLARDFEDPVPPEVSGLDLVTFNFNYHDTVWLGVDRARMNRAVFEALKPGGVYIVADHSAREGVLGSVAKSLHRIDEALVRQEIEAAGFKFVADADFLRNPDDWRDTLIFKSEVPTDRFILKYVKP
ncbi:MAG: class I SAM-dependent methyltransferase [Betaproteobacteria bacterium]|nr:class I SAM-dependent methyltransferase [Betaproteobacteria bacterium]